MRWPVSCSDPGLHVVGDERRHEDHQIQAGEPIEARQPAGRDMAIDRDLDQVWLRERRARAKDDGDKGKSDMTPVGPEIAQQATHQLRVVGFPEDLVVVDAAHDAASSSSSNCFLCNAA